MIKSILILSISAFILIGCASKFNQSSYDRQNNAAEKSQNSL
nr:hypothetical protein [Sulfurimonas sp. MAG313]